MANLTLPDPLFMVKGMFRRTTLVAASLALLGGSSGAVAQPALERTSSTTQAALSADQRPDEDEVARDGDEEAADAEDEEVVFGEDIPLYDPGGHSLDPLYRALHRAEAGEGQARILVYGASHVAADFFTGVLRDRLQARFGNAGHGFIMPVRPWRYYRHRGGMSVESSRRWDTHRVRANTRDIDALGLAGMAVETDRAGEWGRLDTGEQTASRFELYYWKQPDGGSFDISLDGRRVRRVSTGADEPGPGYALITTEDAHHVLEVRVRGTGPVRLFGVTADREVPGVIVDNYGINGARAASHLLWEEELHIEHLRRRDPDLVILAYGTNESGDVNQPIEDYEADLRRVVARVRGTVSDAACMLIGPSDRPMHDDEGEYVDRPRTGQLVDIQRRVSRDMGCSFFDLVAFGGGPLHMLEWADADPPWAQSDHVHYTVRGYLRLGDVLTDDILAGYGDEPTFDPPAAVRAGPPR